MADRWGRKFPIIIGCLLMILGGILGAFCKDYDSMYLLIYEVLIPIADLHSQCTSPVVCSSASATAWLRWPPRFFSPRSAIPSTVARSLPSTTACGTWVHWVGTLVMILHYHTDIV